MRNTQICTGLCHLAQAFCTSAMPGSTLEEPTKKTGNDNITKSANRTVNSERTKSEGSSREANHIVTTLISSLISHSVQSDIIPDKMYVQKKLGEAYADWWCVVDSLMLSLQKIVKIKKLVPDEKTRADSPSKNGKLNEQIKAELQSKNSKKKAKKENSEPVKGKVVSNIKASLEIAHAYACLEPETSHNERIALRSFEDPNHISLVLEAYFY